jgi:hypothetical protein
VQIIEPSQRESLATRDMARLLLAVLLVAGCLACAGASHMLVHDCSHRHLDSPGHQAEDLVLAGPAAAAGLTAALAGLVPPQPLDREAAAQVGRAGTGPAARRSAAPLRARKGCFAPRAPQPPAIAAPVPRHGGDPSQQGRARR